MSLIEIQIPSTWSGGDLQHSPAHEINVPPRPLDWLDPADVLITHRALPKPVMYRGALPTSSWLRQALIDAALATTGTNRTYAEQALNQASNVTNEAPRIYPSPKGGAVIEHRFGDRRVTLIIEGTLGLIASTSSDSITNSTVEINMTSINELLRRYLSEIRLSQS